MTHGFRPKRVVCMWIRVMMMIVAMIMVMVMTMVAMMVMPMRMIVMVMMAGIQTASACTKMIAQRAILDITAGCGHTLPFDMMVVAFLR